MTQRELMLSVALTCLLTAAALAAWLVHAQ